MDKPTVGSLFSGFGGMDLGFERSGFITKWQVEIEDYARKLLNITFPWAEQYVDVRMFPPSPESTWLLHQWKKQYGIDLLLAGFPCQDISYAGNGAGLEGKRSGLFYEVARIIRLLAPGWIVLENVPALLTRGLGQVLGTLASLGYDAEWHCIPASAFGATHKRDRIFIIANSYGIRLQGWTYKRSCRKSGPRRAQQLTRLLKTSVESGVPTSNGGGVHDGVPFRMEQIRGYGNAVFPDVAEFIGKQLIKVIRTKSVYTDIDCSNK